MIVKFNNIGNQEFADLVSFIGSPEGEIPDSGRTKAVVIKSAKPGPVPGPPGDHGVVWSVTLEVRENWTNVSGKAVPTPITCFLEVLKIIEKFSVPV